jgi:hypothetical protein
MKKSFLIATAVLLSTTGIGVALAATEFHASVERVVSEFRSDADATATADGRFQVADGHRDRDRRNGAERRRHHDDDDEDDDAGGDDDGARGPSVPVTGPTDPNAPVPDNGLFNGKARPRVQVN